MTNKFVAIPTEVANAVRQSLRSLEGCPAHKEPAGDGLPCRHCLRVITPQKEQAILFTYNRFTESREACMPFYPEKRVPLDAYCAAILDRVVVEKEC